MKALLYKKITLFILLIPLAIFSQNNKAITIKNVPNEVVWPIVYKTFKDLELKYPLINKQLGEGKTNFFNYSTMLAKNRAKYKIVYANSNLTISLFDRQYYSKSSGWADNIMPISKKQIAKFLHPIENYMLQLLENKKFLSKYISTTNNITNTTIQNTTTKPKVNNKIELKIEGDHKLKTGTFGEKSENPLIIYAFSTQPEIQIQWKTDSKYLIISIIKEGDLEYKNNKSGIRIYALEGDSTTAILTAYQEIDDTTITTKKTITIIKPNYYYFPYPSCDELLELNLISKIEHEKCLDDEDNCEDLLMKNNDIILENDPKLVSSIISEHVISNTKLVDPDTKLNSKKLNFVRKLWKKDGSAYPVEEAGQLREFVKVAPCMAKWSGKNDREKIILLANEGSSKIKAINEQIISLQKVVNATNYQKIANDISNLEKTRIPIIDNYLKKINAIAQKRTIKYATKKTDKENYYSINGAEITGCSWNYQDENPILKMEIFFTSNPTTKKINNKTFKIFLRRIGFNFIDGSEKPVGYMLSLSNKEDKRTTFKTSIRMKLFKKEIEYLDFFKSISWAERIDL